MENTVVAAAAHDEIFGIPFAVGADRRFRELSDANAEVDVRAGVVGAPALTAGFPIRAGVHQAAEVKPAVLESASGEARRLTAEASPHVIARPDLRVRRSGKKQECDKGYPKPTSSRARGNDDTPPPDRGIREALRPWRSVPVDLPENPRPFAAMKIRIASTLRLPASATARAPGHPYTRARRRAGGRLGEPRRGQRGSRRHYATDRGGAGFRRSSSAPGPETFEFRRACTRAGPIRPSCRRRLPNPNGRRPSGCRRHDLRSDHPAPAGRPDPADLVGPVDPVGLVVPVDLVVPVAPAYLVDLAVPVPP